MLVAPVSEGHACHARRSGIDSPTLRIGPDKRVPPRGRIGRACSRGHVHGVRILIVAGMFGYKGNGGVSCPIFSTTSISTSGIVDSSFGVWQLRTVLFDRGEIAYKRL